MRIATPLAALVVAVLLASAASAQTAQPLPFSQDWSNLGLITVDDDWSGVPGMIGYRGDDFGTGVPTSTPGVDPQTVVIDLSATPVDVNTDELDPNTFNSGGLTEFHIVNPTVALNGSGTADAPSMVIRVVTTGLSNIRVQYNIRDIDGSIDDAIQQVNLQYRVGTTGDYTNVAGGYVPDATTTGTATQVTAIDLTLPASANNQPSVDIRIMSANSLGNDEWVGIDDIRVSSGTVATEPGTGRDALELTVASNPVRGASAVRFALAEAAAVRLAAYDVLGREVAVLADGARAAGASTATLDASALAPGVYVLRLTAGAAAVTRTITVVR